MHNPHSSAFPPKEQGLKDLRIIVGLGKTGLSCVRYCVQQGIPAAVVDTRDNPPGLAELRTLWPQVPIVLGGLSAKVLMQASEIILSPGVALQEPAIAACLQQGIPVIGDIEIFARAARAPIVAITGSNAKSTVTTLVGLMAENAGLHVLVGGNIGTPALELLAMPVPDVYVLELSSFQLETTHSLHAAAAAILNICEDHMDRYATLQHYIAAKQRIYQQAKHVIWNRDDLQTQPPFSTIHNQLTFGLQRPDAHQFGIITDGQQHWLAQGAERLLNVADLRIKGRHNWANALAALALGSAVGLMMPAMLKTLREFSGLPHRCAWVAEKNQVQWYNDSKGTNVGSTVAAINGLAATIRGKIILIAGGDGKNADFSDLSAPVAQYVRAAILLGRDAPRLGAALQTVTEVKYVNDLYAAVAVAAQVAQAGDIVLLSPACSSLDMFRNYEHRGDVFVAAVKELTC